MGNATCIELEDDKYNKMSDDLKTRIRNAHQKNDADNVWVECFGRYPADKEALELKYFPDTQAMPAKYFPYRLSVGRGMMESYTAPGTRWGSSSLISTCYLMVIIHPNTNSWRTHLLGVRGSLANAAISTLYLTLNSLKYFC